MKTAVAVAVITVTAPAEYHTVALFNRFAGAAVLHVRGNQSRLPERNGPVSTHRPAAHHRRVAIGVGLSCGFGSSWRAGEETVNDVAGAVAC